MKLERVSIHGDQVSYRTAGSGPVVVLVHGMAGSSRTWKAVAPATEDVKNDLRDTLLGIKSSPGNGTILSDCRGRAEPGRAALYFRS